MKDTDRELHLDNPIWVQWFSWLGTLCYILSWLVLSMGYFPWNIYVEILACTLWLIVTIRWKVWSQLMMHLPIFIFCIISLFTYDII